MGVRDSIKLLSSCHTNEQQWKVFKLIVMKKNTRTPVKTSIWNVLCVYSVEPKTACLLQKLCILKKNMPFPYKPYISYAM